MAKFLYEFLCTAEDPHSFERILDTKLTPNPVCPVFGEVSNLVFRAPRVSLDGCSGDFPGAAIKWEKQRAEKLSQERKKTPNP